MKYYRNPSTGEVFAFDSEEAADRHAPPGVVPMTPPEVAEHLTPPAPSMEELRAQFTLAIQARLDAWARTRNYDGILSACTYATSSVPQFAAEGTRAVLLRDQTWAVAYDILAAVLAGTRPMPTGLADIEGDLPALEWPQ